VIVFLTTRGNDDTVRDFLARGAGPFASRIRVMFYEDVRPDTPVDGPAAIIFADLERLALPALARARAFWDRQEGQPGRRLLNHPGRAMRRYELLRTLHEEGINDFDVYRVTEGRAPRRYPVFVRRETTHDGPLSPLIPDQPSLVRYIRGMLAEGRVRDDLLIVEYAETRDDDGLWRKYGVHMIAGTVVPTQLHPCNHWIAKQAAFVMSERAVTDELDYVRANPRAEEIARLFALARIDFGRMDYSLKDGRIQVWEINTNPGLSGQGIQDPRRRAIAEIRFRRFHRILAALDPEGPPPGYVDDGSDPV